MILNLKDMKYKVALYLLFCFLTAVVQGQTDPPKIVPPSPNAEAFSKYGDIPVSTYTGIPDITIPLYEINVRDIHVPISLSYHASGIKVGEEASRIGLGWVINCGGLINRKIINLYDFIALPHGYLSKNNKNPTIPQPPTQPPTLTTQTQATLHS